MDLFFFLSRGGCMRPLLKNGELLAARPASREDIRPGDCVAFQTVEKTNFLHRVWWKTSRGLWMKDDAGVNSFHFVPFSAVRGKLISDSPWLGGSLGLIWSFFSTLLFSCRRLVH
jgi:hypothetical protein